MMAVSPAGVAEVGHASGTVSRGMFSGSCSTKSLDALLLYPTEHPQLMEHDLSTAFVAETPIVLWLEVKSRTTAVTQCHLPQLSV